MNKVKLIMLLLAGATFTMMPGCTAQNKKYMAHGEKVLVIGRHADMLAKVTTMLKEHGYNAIGRQWNEDAIAAFKADTIDAVVIGGGVDGESRNYFHTEFPKLNPSVKVIDAHPQTILADLKKAFPDKQ
jgi:DNA-binding NtrC family response regulator